MLKLYAIRPTAIVPSVALRSAAAAAAAAAASRHIAKHRTVAKFSGHEEHDPETNEAFRVACNSFEAYFSQLKMLNGHVLSFKKVVAETFGKAGNVGQKLVELTEEDGGDIALAASRTRTVIARIQAALHRKMIPDLDTELLSEISEQLMQMKDIKARITARLTHVADANHYTEKYRALEQQRAMGKVRVPRTRAVFNVCGGSSCGSGGHRCRRRTVHSHDALHNNPPPLHNDK